MSQEIKFSIPNQFIRTDITQQKISRKFYAVYILLNKYRSRENYSWLSIKEVFKWYDYKLTKDKPKAFQEIVSVLNYMEKNEMIALESSLDNLRYDTAILVRINPKKFDVEKHYTLISMEVFARIMSSTSRINKDNLLITYLYVTSYIYRKQSTDGGISSGKPIGSFSRDIASITKDTSLSTTTVTKCIAELINLDLFQKKVTGFQVTSDGAITKSPNIYVISGSRDKKPMASTS